MPFWGKDINKNHIICIYGMILKTNDLRLRDCPLLTLYTYAPLENIECSLLFCFPSQGMAFLFQSTVCLAVRYVYITFFK